MRDPGAFLYEFLSHCDLPGIVSCDEPNQDVGINGARSASSCMSGYLLLFHEWFCAQEVSSAFASLATSAGKILSIFLESSSQTAGTLIVRAAALGTEAFEAASCGVALVVVEVWS